MEWYDTIEQWHADLYDFGEWRKRMTKDTRSHLSWLFENELLSTIWLMK